MADIRFDASAAERVALAKCGGTIVQAVRDRLAVGPHDVDLTVRIVGQVSKGEDYEARKTARILNLGTLVVLMARMGCQRDKAAELLAEVAAEVAQAPAGAQAFGEWLERNYSGGAEAVETAKSLLAEKLAHLPPERHNGKITAKVAVLPVETPAEVAD